MCILDPPDFLLTGHQECCMQMRQQVQQACILYIPPGLMHILHCPIGLHLQKAKYEIIKNFNMAVTKH